MLKLSIKNPTTQETETYDVATEFNQFFNQAKEYGLIHFGATEKSEIGII